jgi:hypothetical protein
VMYSGAVERFFDSVQLRDRRPFSAQLDRVHLPHFHPPLDLRFFLPSTVEVPPYWWQCKLLACRYLRAGGSAHFRVQ